MAHSLFPPLNLPPARLRVVGGAAGGGRPSVLCLSRGRYVALTPEEWVRQHFMSFMVGSLGFPQSLVAVEVPVLIGSSRQRADIVAYSRRMEPLVIVECKAPSVSLSQQTLNQACRYLSVLGARFVVLTNGLSHYCVALSERGTPAYREGLPRWEQLADA